MGEIGCFLSHYFIWEDVSKKKLVQVYVMNYLWLHFLPWYMYVHAFLSNNRILKFYQLTGPHPRLYIPPLHPMYQQLMYWVGVWGVIHISLLYTVYSVYWCLWSYMHCPRHNYLDNLYYFRLWRMATNTPLCLKMMLDLVLISNQNWPD